MNLEKLQNDGPVTAVHFDYETPTIFFDNFNIVIWAEFIVVSGGQECKYPGRDAVYELFRLIGSTFKSFEETVRTVILTIGSTRIEVTKGTSPDGDTLAIVGGRLDPGLVF